MDKKKWLSLIHPPVFFPSVFIIFSMVVCGLLFPHRLQNAFDVVSHELTRSMGWFYILSMSGFLICALYLAFSKFGNIRLGDDNSRPEFGRLTWLSMLFSAGMGIGLLFFGVAEPLMHFYAPAPPALEAGTILAARNSMALTFFHWGFHPWACYTLVGLSLAYFSFRKKMPLTFRSALFPIFGKKIDGKLGHIVDITAIVATLFGVATSLGFGSLQINAGFNVLFGLAESPTIQVIIIAVVTGFATVSVVSGLSKGIKFLSEMNMVLATLLVLSIFLLGPTQHLLNAFVSNIGNYLQTLPRNAFWTAPFDPDKKSWLSSWTVFYWAWWISWSPFVGMFLARISKGRTIREFVFGVLFTPVGLTLAWFTIFGNTAIYFEMNQITDLQLLVSESLPRAMYAFLEAFPWAPLLKGIATISVILFFITSSDSASLVIDMLASGGQLNPNKAVKVFWATTEGLVAAALLLAGGLKALQTAAITTALPFCIILLLAVWGLLRTLRQEKLP